MSILKLILRCFRAKVNAPPGDIPPPPVDETFEVTLEDIRLSDPNWWIREEKDDGNRSQTPSEFMRMVVRLGLTEDTLPLFNDQATTCPT